MLIGIIKNETNNDDYYIHLDEKDNVNKLSIIHVSDNIIEPLSKDKARSLFNTILSSKLTYSRKENDYDIYFDEANNQRYFKDGKENFLLFLENNGVDAIRYYVKIGRKKTSTAYKFVIGGLVVTLIISSMGLFKLVNNTEYDENPSFELVSIDTLTAEELANMIRESKNLTEDEKKLLINEEFFQFVLNNSNSNTQSYHLRSSFKDISIKDYDGQFEKDDIYGYYDPVDTNTIHMRKSLKDSQDYNKVLIHEFIHMAQAPNNYRYIQEGCTEILRREFFDQPYYGYGDMVWRIKMLMEIIGPEPVLDCNFNTTPTLFENSIKKYLDEEDANKLLELFHTAPQKHYNSAETMNKTNSQIDELLAKMYKNKTGKDIKDDELMNDLYFSAGNSFLKSSVVNRIYFNPNHENYYSETVTNNPQALNYSITIEDALNSNNIESYQYRVYETVKIGDKNERIPKAKKTTDFSSIPTENIFDVTIYFKDGTYGIMHYDYEQNKWKEIEMYKRIITTAPSIPEKFKDQAQKPIIIDNSKSI